MKRTLDTTINRPKNEKNDGVVMGQDPMTTTNGTSTTIHSQLYIPYYDNNGNIMSYWDVQGNVVAEYTYDAFGNTISQSGPMSDFFRHRFSTKYFDSETGLYYYGYRYYSPVLMRWLTRDPIEESGGVNLYAMCGNNDLCEIDPNGYSRYVLWEEEPPRRITLTSGTWNTFSAPRGTWFVQMRANMTVFGGRLASWPDAAAHLRHFLENTGAPLDIRFRNMNHESSDAEAHLINEVEDAIRYAEMLANKNGRFVMVTPSETDAENRYGNWLYAVGKYSTWARASVVRCGDSFSMNWHFYFRDIYDWEMGTGKGGGFITDEEMALLHRYGKAKEFEMNGRHYIHLEWQRGQRMNSGVKVIGL